MKTVKELLISLSITKESRHHYGQFYDKHFNSYKDVKKVLEIGVDTGISIQAWLDYFTVAKIYGMDVSFPPKLLFNDPEKRVTLFLGDQGNLDVLDEFTATHGSDFDIIIDDGGHTMQQQQLTFKTYFPLLKPGGMYVVEDLHTSYIMGHQYNPTSTAITTLSLLQNLEKDLKDRTLQTEFIDVEELNAIKEQIEYCIVEKDLSTPGDQMDNSEIAFIKKKY
jgi:predicted O-methyltransferase YrrM